MVHEKISDGRNIVTAEQNWDSSIEFGDSSNSHKLVGALLSAVDNSDEQLDQVFESQHIDTASGEDLEQFGKLVGVQPQMGENEDTYRLRIQAAYAQSNTTTDFDAFVQFCSAVLSTDVSNIKFSTDYVRRPATVTIFANGKLYDRASLSATEIADILAGGVPAGHTVEARRRGTFRLKKDNGFDNPDKGLTGDSIETGGTLGADLIE